MKSHMSNQMSTSRPGKGKTQKYAKEKGGSAGIKPRKNLKTLPSHPFTGVESDETLGLLSLLMHPAKGEHTLAHHASRVDHANIILD